MSEPTEAPKPKDPMKGFRGVMSGTLIMEGITVALALPVVNKLGGGISTGVGWTVIAVAVLLVVTCGFVKRPWAVPLILALQVVLIALVFWLPAITVLGVIFLAIWLWLLWLRKDVARRMAAGTLASQQQPQA
ncbi:MULTISPECIES: DUF4233 domain-containing protein [unclassified Amycolatopsis]|uniref:DUF4233 domain-containing protein n=2 Tax=Pseudonocardiaceae TaxID=2070 RepID=UPI001FF454B3|nr:MULTISPECIES: DUF4233 domain-containing protein [unclassified Amycolatopsis]UOX89677.1 DUF4233 domain-containing protein [Amycolatopsis sp. FBCC-B4732]